MKMGIKRVIFFVESPFNQRDYDRFGIDILQKNGLEVEVWDFTPFLHPQVIEKVKVPDPINWKNCHSFLTWNDAFSAILKLPHSCLIVCLIRYQLKSFSVYRAISRSKLPYCVFIANALPSIDRKKSAIDLFNNLKKITPYKIMNAVFVRIPHKYMEIQPASIILAGGAKLININYPVTKKTETLWMHTLDYDIYLKLHHDNVQRDINVGVFLDEYLPFHPDYINMGVSAPATPKEYYPLLCKLFDFIESESGVHIVIAAHPRSDYERHPDYFGERPVIRGKTVELVRKSRFVIAHSSTSINFAVLFHKPIIFITSNKLQQSFMGPQIEQMASQLGKETINIDNLPAKVNWEKELSINEDAYMNYKHYYIKKTGSDELPFWQILANLIKKFNY